MKWIFVIALFLNYGCTAEQKLHRILRKNPHLVKTDTIFRRDTIHIKEIHADTVFMAGSRDTVILDRGRMEVRYVYRNGQVQLSGTCRDSVIVREVPVQVNSVQPPSPPPDEVQVIPWWVWLIIGGALLIAVIALLKR